MCISRATLEQCVARGVPRERCIAIPCGVDFRRPTPVALDLATLEQRHRFRVEGRRLLMGGPVGLRWDKKNLVYIPRKPNVTSALRAFNHTNNYASLPTPKAAVGQYLRDLNAYYGFGGEIDDQTRQ